MPNPLTFAFGSNLDLAQMRRRCPSAAVVARATLPRHRLVFAGFSPTWGGAVATVVPARDDRVEGLLYRLTPEDLAALDRFEGHPFCYERRPLRVRDEHGRVRRAQTYVAPVAAGDEGLPSRAYLLQIWDAYAAHGFDDAPLFRAVRAPRAPAPTPHSVTYAARRAVAV